ncbi:NRDE family protein [Sinomicrobium sp. M5D2P9]
MCTVSFVNTGAQVILTSNRDESTVRPIAFPPEIHIINHKKVVFPKDSLYGGSWFATDTNGTTAILLNGAREKHIPKGNYRKSRGLILLEIIGADSPVKHWTTINLHNIEPFTILLFSTPDLFLLRWDGTAKETIALEAEKLHILSSSTLYTKAKQQQREQWFHRFTTQHEELTPEKLRDFHQYTEKDDKETGLVINRGNLLRTLSITQSVIGKDSTCMHYLQLYPEKEFLSVRL